MSASLRFLGVLLICTISTNISARAQDPQKVIGSFMDLMGKVRDEIAKQKELERQRKDQEIQPGGLTHAQVIILQQLLLDRGYDVGAPDGIIGPKTRTVVGQLQFRAGMPVDGNPTPQLFEALLQGK
jgi:peptidoglycan hydrolase-like protein with peptidoglycan-binding domain